MALTRLYASSSLIRSQYMASIAQLELKHSLYPWPERLSSWLCHFTGRGLGNVPAMMG
jgi:hypothetical protein